MKNSYFCYSYVMIKEANFVRTTHRKEGDFESGIISAGMRSRA